MTEPKPKDDQKQEPKGKTFTLKAPDGRTYKTTNQTEAEHLNRTAGYTIN